MSLCKLCHRFQIIDEKRQLCEICQLRCSATSTVFDTRAENYASFLGWFMSNPGSFAFTNTNFIIYPTKNGVHGKTVTMCLHGMGIPVSWVDNGHPLDQYGIH
jgi:hypothetical protein